MKLKKSMFLLTTGTILLTTAPLVAAQCGHEDGTKTLTKQYEQMVKLATENDVKDATEYKANLDKYIATSKALLECKDVPEDAINSQNKANKEFLEHIKELISSRKAINALTLESFKTTYLKNHNPMIKNQQKGKLIPETLMPEDFDHIKVDDVTEIIVKPQGFRVEKPYAKYAKSYGSSKNEKAYVEEGKTKVHATLRIQQSLYPTIGKDFEVDFEVSELMKLEDIKKTFAEELKTFKVDTTKPYENGVLYLEQKTNATFDSLLRWDYDYNKLADDGYININIHNQNLDWAMSVKQVDRNNNSVRVNFGVSFKFPQSNVPYLMYKGKNELELSPNPVQDPKGAEEFTISNLPKVLISPLAFPTFLNMQHALDLNEEKVLKATGKSSMGDLEGKDLTPAIVQQTMELSNSASIKKGSLFYNFKENKFSDLYNLKVTSVDLVAAEENDKEKAIVNVEISLKQNANDKNVYNYILANGQYGSILDDTNKVGRFSFEVNNLKKSVYVNEMDKFMEDKADKLNVEVKLSADELKNAEETLLKEGKAYGKYGAQIEISKNQATTSIPKNNDVEKVSLYNFATLLGETDYTLVPVKRTIYQWKGRTLLSKYFSVKYNKETKTISYEAKLAQNVGTRREPEYKLSDKSYKGTIKLVLQEN
ncbi:hypothetical protein [Mycoplasmopsis verecunda]|uniref:Uncharacterized protein n=1 Tax=Mycoplasmopsis verecunda TaxID=171291 RepID=A0A1T4LRF2_9BACT|nr:hypothetical protein [Mycoplasmopsis verecunda]SJZ57265.1 hypothetical protein SAMN02745154_00522 [Mycoplasmopsis verecunda]